MIPGQQTYSMRAAVSASLAAQSSSLSTTSSIEIKRVLLEELISFSFTLKWHFKGQTMLKVLVNFDALTEEYVLSTGVNCIPLR